MFRPSAVTKGYGVAGTHNRDPPFLDRHSLEYGVFPIVFVFLGRTKLSIYNCTHFIPKPGGFLLYIALFRPKMKVIGDHHRPQFKRKKKAP